ncbi:hypothetical protein [Microvirga guangxiensis]|uniref:Heat induced stress protein YflT n=1 Tax=Microvirga guangxiensis TaxID=549386 RepID=A0A1G5JR06_9HYPH|nr:hypothetical protein [Microvirga guangxiensis]SCY90766.1 hypothetical protein SAMN02927923_02835 [Microvirga guangxiensis]
MTERKVTAFFNTYDEAAKAVQRLEAAQIPNFEISLISSNANDIASRHATRSLEGEDGSHEFAGAGATAGTIAGGGAGLLAGLGTVAVPGLGPVVAAGWLVSTLVGAGAGAAFGGLMGALADAGLNEDEAKAYVEGVRQGGTLVTVRVSEGDMDRVVNILDDEGRIEPGRQERDWRSEGAAPPIGAAASTTTGLITDLMPNPLDEEDDHTLHVEMEDERLRRMKISGTDKI